MSRKAGIRLWCLPPVFSPSGFAVAPFVLRLHEMQYHVDEMAVWQALGGGNFNVIRLA